jgi:hypothetical protein
VNPIDAAIRLVRRDGCYGAKQYVARMLAGKTERGAEFWRAVNEIVGDLNCHRNRDAIVAHLLRVKGGAAITPGFREKPRTAATSDKAPLESSQVAGGVVGTPKEEAE